MSVANKLTHILFTIIRYNKGKSIVITYISHYYEVIKSFQCKRYDIVDKLGYLEVTIEYKLVKPEIRVEFID